MDARSLVLMEKEDGILNHEIGSYEIETGLKFVYKAYVEDGKVYLYLTTDRDVQDDEFNAIYDNYDSEYIEQEGCTVEEVDDEYNPVWCLKFDLEEEHMEIQDMLNDIIAYHETEIKRIYDLIAK